ncbi:MAG: hypothetical protein LBT83_07225 [Tannerella sp.]|jgi:hypothetical protein|nr:hypothetical protein [Tannerella sp.]
MKKVEFKNRKVALKGAVTTVASVIMLLAVFTDSPAREPLRPSAKQTAGVPVYSDIQSSGDDFPAAYAGYEKVRPEDNKIGFSITGFSVEEGEIHVEWKSSSEVIMRPGRNHQLIAALLHFVDPDDFANRKGGLECSFQGDIGSHDKMSFSLDKMPGGLLIYFEGMDNRSGEEYVTAPMFFMATTENGGKLIDTAPRYAGELFHDIPRLFEKEK